MRRATTVSSFVTIALLTLAACGKDESGEVKSIKDQVQLAYGNKDFAKGLELSKKGFALARTAMGDTATDTLYFAQAISENTEKLHNTQGEISALKQELALRTAAHQPEKKLQTRRTKLIQLAEENGDHQIASDQALLIARGIKMAPGKDPQPVYKVMTNYPPEQYRQKIEGDVEVSYGLDAGGKVTGARVVKSTPAQVFDNAALESFRQWRFTPMLDTTGQPVSASGLTFTIGFRMGGK